MSGAQRTRQPSTRKHRRPNMRPAVWQDLAGRGGNPPHLAVEHNMHPDNEIHYGAPTFILAAVGLPERKKSQVVDE